MCYLDGFLTDLVPFLSLISYSEFEFYVLRPRNINDSFTKWIKLSNELHYPTLVHDMAYITAKMANQKIISRVPTSPLNCWQKCKWSQGIASSARQQCNPGMKINTCVGWTTEDTDGFSNHNSHKNILCKWLDPYTCVI